MSDIHQLPNEIGIKRSLGAMEASMARYRLSVIEQQERRRALGIDWASIIPLANHNGRVLIGWSLPDG